jgi:hypothetical protein
MCDELMIQYTLLFTSFILFIRCDACQIFLSYCIQQWAILIITQKIETRKAPQNSNSYVGMKFLPFGSPI